MPPITRAHELYNQGTSLNHGRNNDHSDQTSSAIQNQGTGTLKALQHTNSSNKDSSPQNVQSKDAAFMRAILRDDTLSPYTDKP